MPAPLAYARPARQLVPETVSQGERRMAYNAAVAAVPQAPIVWVMAGNKDGPVTSGRERQYSDAPPDLPRGCV